MRTTHHAISGHAQRAQTQSARHPGPQRLMENLEDRQLFTVAFGVTDTAFGAAGHAIVFTPNAKTTPQVDQLVVGSDGKLYAGGTAGVARFNAKGTIDTTFGTKGVAAPVGGRFVAEAVDQQGHVYVLVVSSSNAVLLRYTAAGLLDTAYGQGGTALVSSDANFTPTAMDVQSDGKLVVAGTELTNSGKGAAMRVFRVNTDGSADSGFGSSGSLQATLGTGTFLTPVLRDNAVGVKVLGSGKILVGGGSVAYAPSANNNPATLGAANFAVALITSGGQLDGSYGIGGISRSQYASAGDVSGSYFENNFTEVLPAAFAARADGSCVVAASLSLNGSLATNAASFDPHGAVSFEEQVPYDGLGDGALKGAIALNDGRAVLLRESALGTSTGFGLTPLLSDGSLGQTALTDDLSTVTTDITGNDPATIAIAPGGQVVVGGTPNSGGGYELQQFHQGSRIATRTDNFAHATTNSIATDTSGGVFVAFYNSSKRSLQYAHRYKNGLWSLPVTVDKTPGAGQYLSLAVTPAGQPSISYYDAKSRHLKLARSADGGKTFSSVVIDASGTTGQSSSLYIDPTTGTPSIAYYSKSRHALRFATIKKHKWVLSTIDSGDDVGRGVVLSPTYQSGRLSVAYVDNTVHAVKWAALTSGKWKIKTVAKAKGDIDSLSMGYNASDQPAIAFRDVASGDLRLSIFSTAFVTHTIQTQVGAGSGLAFPSYYGDASVYTYSKASDSVQLIADPLDARNISTVVVNGGANLSISAPSSSVAFAAFIDSASQQLEVRPLPES